jgi:hypothetical protein
MKKTIFFWSLILFSATGFSQTFNNMNGGFWQDNANTVPGYVYALCNYNGDLYAGGNFVYAGSLQVNAIAKWNGQTWSFVSDSGLAIGHIIYSFAVYNGQLYATGSDNDSTAFICEYTGSSWTTIGTGTGVNTFAPIMGYTLSVYNGNLYVGGTFTYINGISCNGIGKWNGTSWVNAGTAFANGNFYPGIGIYVLSVINNKLYAGGYFTSINSDTLNEVAVWDDMNWAAMGNNLSSAYIGNGVTAITEFNNNIYIGGVGIQTTDSGSHFSNMSLVAKWNGSEWGDVNNGYVTNVNAMLAYDSTLIIGSALSGGNNQGNTLGQLRGDTVGVWPNSDFILNAPEDVLGNFGSAYCFASYNGYLILGGYFSSDGNNNYGSIVEFTSVTGIKKITQGALPVIYPNPSATTLILQNLTIGSPVRVTNVLGQEFIKTTASGTNMSLDISALAPGLYLVNQVKFIKD